MKTDLAVGHRGAQKCRKKTQPRMARMNTDKKKAQQCRRCGCTNRQITAHCDQQSKGRGCSWVEADLCSACLTATEKRRLGKQSQFPPSDRHDEASIVKAIKLQIQTLMDSFDGCARDESGNLIPATEGYVPHDVASEIECLQMVIQLVFEVTK